MPPKSKQLAPAPKKVPHKPPIEPHKPASMPHVPAGPPGPLGPPGPPGPPSQPKEETSEDDIIIAPPPPPPPPPEQHNEQKDEDAEDVPPPPPPPPSQETPQSCPSSPDSSSSDSESEEEDDDVLDAPRRESSTSVNSQASPSPPPPPLPPPPPPPPLVDDDFNFSTIDLEDSRWNILRAGENGVLKFCYRMKSVFLWLPPAMRWSKNVMAVEDARTRVQSVLEKNSHKLVQTLVDIRKATEELESEGERPTEGRIQVHDDYWRWRFTEGWQKQYNDLKMAQNAEHCNSILRTGCMLLREYRNFMQHISEKVETARNRDPQAGLRLSRARIKQEILKKKLEAVAKEEKLRIEALRKKMRAGDVQKSSRQAVKRVRRLTLAKYHKNILNLRQQLIDERIQQHLDKEFEPAWRTSIDVSQSYVHALQHAIKLEKHHMERKRRRKAKFTCKETIKRVRQRKRDDYGKKSHVFVRPLSRLVGRRGQESRRSPVQPREILHRF